MTRPLHAATLAVAASAVFVLFASPAVQAGGPPQFPGPLPLPAPAVRIVPAAAPVASGSSVSVPVYVQRGRRYVYDGFAQRSIASGAYPLGYGYDPVLARSFATGPAPYAQPGPAIIIVGNGAAAQPDDPIVLPAPPEADRRTHGVRVVYLTDPPAEYQLQAGAAARPRKGAAPPPPIKPNY